MPKHPDKNTKHATGHNSCGKHAGFTYCTRCGLFYLRNKPTREAIKDPCPGNEDAND